MLNEDSGMKKALDKLERYCEAINRETNIENKNVLIENLKLDFSKFRREYVYSVEIWDFYRKKLIPILDEQNQNPNVERDIEYFRLKVEEYLKEENQEKKEAILRVMDKEFQRFRHGYLLNNDTTSAYKLQNAYNIILRELDTKQNTIGSK